MAVGTRLTGLAGVRLGEGRLVVLVSALFACLEAGRGLGEVGANALVVARLGSGVLPWLYIGLGSLLLVLGLAYGAALMRVRPDRLLTGLLLGVAALLGLEVAVLLGVSAPVVGAAAWLTVAAATTIEMTVAWTVASSSVDARQAKRLFPVFTAAAIGGNLVGSLVAGRLAELVSSEAVLAAQAVLFASAALLIPGIARLAGRGGGWAAPASARRSVVAGLRSGFDEVRAVPLLRLVAVAYVLFAVLSFSISFPFFQATERAYPDEAEMAGVLSGIQALVAGVSLVVALVVAKRIYARFGVAAAALLLPLVYVGGFALWIVQFGFVTAATVLVTQQVTQRGLSNGAWSAFYAVVPSTRRAKAIAFIDAVPGQLGIVVSGILLLTVGRLLPPEQVAWLGLVAAIACTAVVLQIRRRYAGALLATLKAGASERVLDGGPAIGDLAGAPDVRATLIDALRSDDADVRAMAAGLLAGTDAADSRAALAAALRDPHPGVRSASIVAILDRAGQDGPGDATTAAERCLRDLLGGDPLEQVLGFRALHRLRRVPDPDLLEGALRGADAPLRAMALACLPLEDPRTVDRLVDALRDPAGLVRRAASGRLAALDEPPAAVLASLHAPEPEVRRAALEAMDGHGPRVRDVVLPWAESEVARAIALDTAATRLAATGRTSTLPEPRRAFLVDVLRGRVRQHRELVLGAMAVLGMPEATGVLRRAIASPDGERRAQATEALETLADRRLGAALARLIDRPPTTSQGDDDTVRRLTDDEDRWIRALARMVAGDPRRDDIDAEPTPNATIERMLHLRRVPLFAGLVPEDLQRLAMAASERTWPDGADIVVEGDPGDELFVIVEGRVRVVRREADGAERVLRTYEEGDHFGELAVLRDRPRAATVVADGGPVHTLGLDGQALAAILRERPEAAMAMLATLAERIGTQ
jgi:HEAT repeat protein